MPHLENHDGSTNPVDHLKSFKAVMLNHGATYGILCQAFPTTLKKAAWYWYFNLKLNSIYSFDQLTRSSVAHFTISRRQHQESNSLMGIKEKEEKSLRSYISFFNMDILEVWNLVLEHLAQVIEILNW